MTTGYDKSLDGKRLAKQFEFIREAMLYANNWKTLQEIEALTGYPQASISAQLRHLRKPQYGSYIVEKRRRGAATSGCWEYLVRRPEADQSQSPLFQEASA